jgi:arylamine N-acetyltransferase
MILSVTLPEGTFIADPGFACAISRASPVPLVDRREVRVGNDVHWMARDEDRWWGAAQPRRRQGHQLLGPRRSMPTT